MMDSLDEAREELKRVDHLIYVSLKYTRTVDVLINATSRMVDAYTKMFDALLEKALEDKKIDEMPKTPIEKGNKLKKIYLEDEQVLDNVELYFLLRKIRKAQGYKKEQEYRRHVAMTTIVNGKEEILNIDIITSYYHFQLEFFKRVNSVVSNEEDG